MIAPENLRTVKQFVQECPAFTEQGIRWLIFNAESNGFSAVIVRVGRRVLLDREEFRRFLAETSR
jgi:hypothetical protein